MDTALLDALLRPESLAAAGAVLAGGLVRGLAGFGGALVMVPLLSLAFGPAQAVATVLLIEAAGFVQMLPAAAPTVRWREIAPMVAVAAAAVPLGVWLVVTVDPAVMRRVIGAVVMALAVLLALAHGARVRHTLLRTVGIGALSGTLQGLSGTPGPPVVLYMLAGPGSAMRARHNLVGYFVCLDTVGVALFAYNGVIGPVVLVQALALWPFSIAGTWLGGRLLPVVPDRALRRLALGLIMLVGLFGVLH